MSAGRDPAHDDAWLRLAFKEVVEATGAWRKGPLRLGPGSLERRSGGDAGDSAKHSVIPQI